jgi:hypothetical protein
VLQPPGARRHEHGRFEEDRTLNRFRPVTDGVQGSQDRANGGASKRRLVLLVILPCATVLLALLAFAGSAKAEPPTGVTPTLLARGTYDAFNVRSAKRGPLRFTAQAKTPIDLVVRQHDYAPRSTTGWHSHPGPVFITVTQGTLTYYAAHDPTCTPRTVSVGQGFVDDGHGHVVRNESDQPAQDISVIVAPVGGTFRTDLPAPNPACGF